MQAAAASKALEALPGRALLDPFAGGGTTLVVGMADGRATKGVDVSPLACAVAAHRAWRPSGGDATLALMRDAARAVVERMDVTAGEMRREEREDAKAAAARGEDDDGEVDDDYGGGKRKPGGVPRDWRVAQRALADVVGNAASIDGGGSGGDGDGVEGALWHCFAVALQRSSKSKNKRRPCKRQRKKAAAAAAD